MTVWMKPFLPLAGWGQMRTTNDIAQARTSDVSTIHLNFYEWQTWVTELHSSLQTFHALCDILLKNLDSTEVGFMECTYPAICSCMKLYGEEWILSKMFLMTNNILCVWENGHHKTEIMLVKQSTNLWSIWYVQSPWLLTGHFTVWFYACVTCPLIESRLYFHKIKSNKQNRALINCDTKAC